MQGAVIALLLMVLIAAAVIVLQSHSVGLALFELMTFAVGVAALVLAVLGSVSSAYQMRVTKRIASEMRHAITELKDIDRTNEAIRRKLNQDYALAKDIAEALAEAGIIEDDTKRHAVAGEVERKVRTRVR